MRFFPRRCLLKTRIPHLRCGEISEEENNNVQYEEEGKKSGEIIHGGRKVNLSRDKTEKCRPKESSPAPLSQSVSKMEKRSREKVQNRNRTGYSVFKSDGPITTSDACLFEKEYAGTLPVS